LKKIVWIFLGANIFWRRGQGDHMSL
jgi:hypothetical protein